MDARVKPGHDGGNVKAMELSRRNFLVSDADAAAAAAASPSARAEENAPPPAPAAERFGFNHDRTGANPIARLDLALRHLCERGRRYVRVRRKRPRA